MLRRRRRHIEIFSISALDLFASALGAFILVTIILFPYYGEGRTAPERLALKDETIRRLESQLEAARPPGPPFVLVRIRWAASGADVDLHVTDPAGQEFFWRRPNASGLDYASSAAELSSDMTGGPGVEVWEHPAATPGPYQIDYVANGLPAGSTVEVSGAVFDRTGRRALPPRTLRTAKERVRAATLTVEDDGRVAIR